MMNHNTILEDIVRRLKHNKSKYDLVYKCEEFSLLNGDCGEIDIYKLMPDRREVWAIEVKRSKDKQQRAQLQLLRDLDYMKEKYDIDTVKTFFAYADKNCRRGYYVTEVK